MMRPFEVVGELGLLFGRTVRAAVREGLSWREVWLQLYDLGNRTVGFVLTGMVFFGAVMVTILDGQARRFTGSLVVLGSAYVELVIRELGPMVAALLAAARSGASHSAELAQMSVNEQVEALEMSAGDPLADLVAPRIVASAVAVPLLGILGGVMACFSGAFTASTFFDTDPRAFLDTRYLDWGDLASGFLKAFGAGVFIPLAAAWRALGVSGGSEAVGHATTSGVVASCVGCLVIAFVVAVAFFLVGL